MALAICPLLLATLNMDGFSIEFGFTPKVAEKISKIGVAIAEAGLHSEFVGQPNEPHVTLAAFDPKTDFAKIKQVTAEFAQSLEPFDITFTSIAQFATAQNVVYLSPLMTADLMEMYQRYQEMLGKAALEPGFYYRPGSWIPHTTITMKGPKADLGATVEIVRKAPVFNRPMRIDHIKIVWYSPFELLQQFDLEEVESGK